MNSTNILLENIVYSHSEFHGVDKNEDSLIYQKVDHFFADQTESITFFKKKINDISYLNTHLKEIYNSLNEGEFLIGKFETFTARRARIFIYKIPILSHLFFIVHFLFNRIIPKIKYINSVYFFFTKGRNRLMSKAEVLGRLVYAGFKIDKVEAVEGYNYFKVQKINNTIKRKKTSYGLIFKMNRIGKNGKFIKVYKFRTMYPYSEFIQDYLMTSEGFSKNGKFKNDFRITPWGKWMRKYWIDELPQIINLLLGNMKLVGVRPTSESYFNILPEDFKILKVKFKPGCIPPYLSLNYKSSFEEVIKAERQYLEEKSKKPYTTDSKYFVYALINIIFKGKRSA